LYASSAVIDSCVSIIPHRRRVVKGEFEGDGEPSGAGVTTSALLFFLYAVVTLLNNRKPPDVRPEVLGGEGGG
jgi:hypothetical protein